MTFWIVVGLIAGWLAERITGRNHGLLTNLIVGSQACSAFEQEAADERTDDGP